MAGGGGKGLREMLRTATAKLGGEGPSRAIAGVSSGGFRQSFAGTVRLGSVRPQAPTHRTVFCNDPTANLVVRFQGNTISTTKCNVFTFLPKILFQQVHADDPMGSLKQRIYGYRSIHTNRTLQSSEQAKEQKAEIGVSIDDSGKPKLKRKKLKGRREVVRWMKYFRHFKKKEFERMTPEEQILYKLKKAHGKKERLTTALKKLEPAEETEATHDPEVLTPEEYFYFLKMGRKCKNYVPVGRRGIFQGVILNMHLHWKKHETLKVIVKTFTADEVKEIAAELARLSGGIVLEIEEENIIIMYRGKNYSQPPTEIMSPKETLSKRKALLKSKLRDELRAVRNYIPRLERELDDLHAQMKLDGAKREPVGEHALSSDVQTKAHSDITSKSKEVFEEPEAERIGFDCEDSLTNRATRLLQSEVLEVYGSEGSELGSDDSSVSTSESEDLSDMFETDIDDLQKDEHTRSRYLDILDEFRLGEKDGEPEEDFEEHLRRIASLSDKPRRGDKELRVLDLDEIDKIFLRATKMFRNSR